MVFFLKFLLYLIFLRDKIENYIEFNIYFGFKLDDRREKENFLKYEFNCICLFGSVYWYGYVCYSIKYYKLMGKNFFLSYWIVIFYLYL